MSQGIILAAFGLTMAGMIACAHPVPVSETASRLDAAELRGEQAWTASIRAAPQTAFVSPDSTRASGYGSALWRKGALPTNSQIDLVFSYGGSERELTWAIMFGTCGSASLQVVPRSSLPEIELSGGGSARVNAILLVELPTSGNYHVDNYRDRRGGSENLVGCGDFKLASAS